MELEEVKPLPAFRAGPLGCWECQMMPFGLTNASATLQRLTESCLGELYLTLCIICLDDITVFNQTPEEHLTRLNAVFGKSREDGLKSKPSKGGLISEQSIT